jgi:hypothetical protein
MWQWLFSDCSEPGMARKIPLAGAAAGRYHAYTGGYEV